MSITPSTITAWIPIAEVVLKFIGSFRTVNNRAPTAEELATAIAEYETSRNRLIAAEDAHAEKFNNDQPPA